MQDRNPDHSDFKNSLIRFLKEPEAWVVLKAKEHFSAGYTLQSWKEQFLLRIKLARRASIPIDLVVRVGWQLCLYLQNFFLHLRVLLIFLQGLPCPSRRKPGKQCPPISRTAFIMDKFPDERHASELSQASLSWLRSAEYVWTKRCNVVILIKAENVSIWPHL